MIVGYDSIEGYIALLKLFVFVSAMLRPRRVTWWGPIWDGRRLH